MLGKTELVHHSLNARITPPLKIKHAVRLAFPVKCAASPTQAQLQASLMVFVEKFLTSVRKSRIAKTAFLQMKEVANGVGQLVFESVSAPKSPSIQAIHFRCCFA